MEDNISRDIQLPHNSQARERSQFYSDEVVTMQISYQNVLHFRFKAIKWLNITEMKIANGFFSK